MDDAFEQAELIFLNALEIRCADARQAYLSAECRDNDSLKEEVNDLLSHACRMGDFLNISDGAELDLTSTLSIHSLEIDAEIGPYRLREKIGEGGMGEVYVAEQRSPVSRKVALKVIRPELASPSLVARFDAERQALAMMDHPNIAKVLDAGATVTGRPYFVMELVRGTSITRFCNEEKLEPRERLSLFVDVCRAVQHAHQKGIIHRDIKPSNVLVTMRDDRPIPKVIDFGIAKALSQKLTEMTIYTRYGQMIGTPPYMSPEQVQLNEVDVDTRSDVYSLGVLLYELLTGKTPFDKESLKRAGPEELRRIICETEPLRPSDGISTFKAEKLSTISSQRSVDSRTLVRSLRGELDWIVMKALEKDRNRRYESPNALASDIERYLVHQPVVAGPPTLTYRARKFLARNKTLSAVAAVTSLCVAMGVMGLCASYVMISRERAAAIQAQQNEETQRLLAEEQKRIAEANFQFARKTVNELTVGLAEDEMFNIPTLQPVRRRLLNQALSYYTTFIQTRGKDPTLHFELAEAYFLVARIEKRIGKRELAERASRKCYELLKQLTGDAPGNLRQQLAFGHSCRILSHYERDAGRIETAEKLARQTLEIGTWLGRKDATVEHRDLAAKGNFAMSKALKARGDRESSLKHVQEGLRILRLASREFPENNQVKLNLAGATTLLSSFYQEAGRADEAAKELEFAIQALKRLTKSKDIQWNARSNLANTYCALARIQLGRNQLKDASESNKLAIQTSRALTLSLPDFKPARSCLVTGYHQLGIVYEKSKQFTKASETWRSGIEEVEKLIVQDNTDASHQRKKVDLLDCVTRVELAQGNFLEAAKWRAKVVSQRRLILQRNSKNVDDRRRLNHALWSFAEIQGQLGKPNEEVRHKRDCLELRKALAADVPSRLDLQEDLVRSYDDLLKRQPDQVALRVDLAWFLATAENERIHDLKRAGQLAEAAVKAEPTNGFYWYTSGVTHYKLHEFGSAAKAFSKALKHRSELSRGFAGFYVAMNAWRFKQRQAALRQYQQSVQWMAQHNPDDRELARFREEAKNLLGIGQE